MKKQQSVCAAAMIGSLATAAVAEPIVIAHRGASGYLPEHTLAAKALAYAMKPDFLEQDVVMTKDDVLVVLHDHYLDRVTNVASKFPHRARADGRYYVIDFTLAEIKSLSATEGFTPDVKGRAVANFSNRFPIWQSHFEVPTLAEEIEMIQGLNKTLGYQVGIYPEIKAPWFHLHEGKDISRAVLNLLKKYGYSKQQDNIYLQCFDPNELSRIHDQLMPELHMDLKLIQLIAYTDWQETMTYEAGKPLNYAYDWMFTEKGMRQIAQFADGIGPHISMLVEESSKQGHVVATPMITRAHAAGLKVHPYTFRAEAQEIPAYATDLNEMFQIFYQQLKVDGVFTDYPDRAVTFLQQVKQPQRKVTRPVL